MPEIKAEWKYIQMSCQNLVEFLHSEKYTWNLDDRKKKLCWFSLGKGNKIFSVLGIDQDCFL